MKRVKQFIKRIFVFCLVISIAITSTGCSPEEMAVATINILDTGFSADTNNNGQQLKLDIEAKFDKYKEVLDKLSALGVVSNASMFQDAMDKNKEYIIDYLCTRRVMDQDLSSSIAWVLDPQYICRLYNDLSYIKQYYEEAEQKSKGNYSYTDIYGSASSNYNINIKDGTSGDIPLDDLLLDSENNKIDGEETEKRDKFLSLYSYLGDITKANKADEGNLTGSINDIAYSLSVLDSMNNKFSLDKIQNKKLNGGWLDGIINIFKGIGGGKSEDKSHPFMILSSGSQYADTYTNGDVANGTDIYRMKDFNNVSIGSKGEVSNAPIINSIHKDNFYPRIEKILKQFKTEGSSDSRCFEEEIKKESSKENSGFIRQIDKSMTLKEYSDMNGNHTYSKDGHGVSSEEFEQAKEDFMEKSRNSNTALSAIMHSYTARCSIGGRHATGHVFSNVNVDVSEIDKEDSLTIITTYTYKADLSAKTSQAIYLNIKEFGSYLVDGCTDTTPITSYYRMASTAITNAGKTLVDIPYVCETTDSSGTATNYSTINDVISKTKSNIKGKNLCAPTLEQNSKYDSNVNIPVYKIQYMANTGDYNIDEFREVLKTYDSQTDEVKKKLGDKIKLYTDQASGEDGFIENTEAIFVTSDYTRHKSNLEYKNVLKSLAFGNTARAAIDYNPRNEIGNDLIVTIAGVPAFAIRLQEFNEYAAVDQANTVQKAVEDGYIMIKTSENKTFALDPRCRIKVIDYIDATQNRIQLKNSNNYYSFLTGHFFKAEEGNETVPIDQINVSDRDFIAQKFIKNNSFSNYFGPSETGYLTLLGYDPIYYEENDNIIDGHWFPIGRTLFLNRNENMFQDIKTDPNVLYIKNAYDPIGYLGSPTTNLYNKSSGTPVYLNEICTSDNQDLAGDEVDRASYFSEDYLDEIENKIKKNTKNNSKKFDKSTKDAPEGVFQTSGDKIYYEITEEPTNKNDFTLWSNGKYYLKEGYWYIPSTDGPDNEQRYYLYYSDSEGYIVNPPDEDYSSAGSEYHFKVISEKYPDGFFKPYKTKTEKIKSNDIILQVTKFANEVKSTFLDKGGDAYSNTNDCVIYVPIVGKANSRRDCSAYACILANKLDEVKDFKKFHLYDTHTSGGGPDAYYTDALIDDLSKTNDTNYTCKKISGVNTGNISSYVKAGDFLIFSSKENPIQAENKMGHIIFISSIDSSSITIYNWTAGSAKGGPFKIPITSTDNKDASKGCCIASGESIRIRIPDISSNPSANPLFSYYHIIRSKS